MTLIVATCQFPVDADITINRDHILDQMAAARHQGADVAHFPECALSGYAGTDFDTYDGFNWTLLEEAARSVLVRASELGIWVVLGSSHRLTGNHKPHNCIYVIDNQGTLVDRYDKRFCAGNPESTEGDLAHYSPGNHSCVFELNGIRCGTLICHEYRYPELYRDYARQNIQLVFHSYHAGHISNERMRFMQEQVGFQFHDLNKGSTLPEITMPAAMHSAAADNYLWISCSNTSAPQNCWASFSVRPDGVIVGQLKRTEPGILITEIDPMLKHYDSTKHWRGRAMRGIFHSGELREDPRSADRTSL